MFFKYTQPHTRSSFSLTHACSFAHAHTSSFSFSPPTPLFLSLPRTHSRVTGDNPEIPATKSKFKKNYFSKVGNTLERKRIPSVPGHINSCQSTNVSFWAVVLKQCKSSVEDKRSSVGRASQ